MTTFLINEFDKDIISFITAWNHVIRESIKYLKWEQIICTIIPCFEKLSKTIKYTKWNELYLDYKLEITCMASEDDILKKPVQNFIWELI